MLTEKQAQIAAYCVRKGTIPSTRIISEDTKIPPHVVSRNLKSLVEKGLLIERGRGAGRILVVSAGLKTLHQALAA